MTCFQFRTSERQQKEHVSAMKILLNWFGWQGMVKQNQSELTNTRIYSKLKED